MAFLESDAKNIASGWAPEPQLSAPNIGETLRAILANRLAQQEQTQKSISAAIKEMQTQRQTSAYTDALRNAGLTQGQDISGMSAGQATGLAKLIQEQTPDTDEDNLRQAMARYYNAGADAGGRGGRGSGVPRYDYNGVQLTGEQYIKQRQADAATAQYGKLVQAESDANGQVTLYQKKYGVDPNSDTGLRGNPTPEDLQAYLQANSDAARLKQQRTTYEKLHHGALHPDEVPTQQPDDDEDSATPPAAQPPPAQPQSTPAMPPGVTYVPGPSGPQGGASPPPQVSVTPPPSGTPRPGVQLAPGYGTPAPGAGSGQVGNLVPGQSRRFVGGKWWVWDGNQWQPE